jgi:hypothetical protein
MTRSLTIAYDDSVLLEASLSREEFEREWSPELHVKLERVSDVETRIVVTNLAKISVLLQMMQLRKISHAVPFERCFLNDPLVGGLTWTQDVGKRLLERGHHVGVELDAEANAADRPESARRAPPCRRG